MKTGTLKVASSLSTWADAGEAATEAAASVVGGLDAVRPHLAAVFVSPHHMARAGEVLEAVRERLRPARLIGCAGEWVVGGGREVEDEPAVSVWAASLPGAGVETFHSEFVRTPDGPALVGFPGPDSTPRAVLLLADPFSFPADALLSWAAEAMPGVPFVGGMASGGRTQGEQRLMIDGEVRESGAVGAVLTGDVAVRTLVSQGCRPVGRSFVVTKAEGNVVHELAGRPAVERLRQTAAEADAADRVLMASGVLIGIVIDEYKEEFGRGDFLVRPVLGGDAETGAIAVGEPVEVGRTVQFQVRDAASADEDLRTLLGAGPRTPAGALLFTCNGRGTRMFPEPHHDVGTLRRYVGDVPVAGFFCAGEIGPVGGRSFVHGFTASVAFFERP